MRYRNCAELIMNVIPGDKEGNIIQLFVTPTDAHFTHETMQSYIAPTRCGVIHTIHREPTLTFGKRTKI